MSKWYGKIGYEETTETSPGVWTSSIIEKEYIGDIYKLSARWQERENSSEDANDDININNRISILADPYAYKNFSKMRYLEFMGTFWKVESVEVNYPRLTLNIGGVWNGQQT